MAGKIVSGNEDLIKVKRDYFVVKSNELIQQSHFKLSSVEQKTVAYICSMIKPPGRTDSPIQLEYAFNIREYCKVCGIDYNSGKNYEHVRTVLKKLLEHSLYVKLPDSDQETSFRWCSSVRLDKNSRIAYVELDKEIVPYLFNLKERYTQYHLVNILAMKSSFSIRIYEILKSYTFRRHEVAFNLDELRKILAVEDIKSYQRFSDFRKRILEPAQREINEYTDLYIDYEAIKVGKKVVKIRFIVNKKDSFDRYKSTLRVNESLGKENY